MSLFYGFVSIDAKTLQTTATSAIVCKVKLVSVYLDVHKMQGFIGEDIDVCSASETEGRKQNSHSHLIRC